MKLCSECPWEVEGGGTEKICAKTISRGASHKPCDSHLVSFVFSLENTAKHFSLTSLITNHILPFRQHQTAPKMANNYQNVEELERMQKSLAGVVDRAKSQKAALQTDAGKMVNAWMDLPEEMRDTAAGQKFHELMLSHYASMFQGERPQSTVEEAATGETGEGDYQKALEAELQNDLRRAERIRGMKRRLQQSDSARPGGARDYQKELELAKQRTMAEDELIEKLEHDIAKLPKKTPIRRLNVELEMERMAATMRSIEALRDP